MTVDVFSADMIATIASIDMEITLRHFSKGISEGSRENEWSTMIRRFLPFYFMSSLLAYRYIFRDTLRWKWRRMFMIREWRLLTYDTGRRKLWEPVP